MAVGFIPFHPTDRQLWCCGKKWWKRLPGECIWLLSQWISKGVWHACNDGHIKLQGVLFWCCFWSGRASEKCHPQNWLEQVTLYVIFLFDVFTQYIFPNNSGYTIDSCLASWHHLHEPTKLLLRRQPVLQGRQPGVEATLALLTWAQEWRGWCICSNPFTFCSCYRGPGTFLVMVYKPDGIHPYIYTSIHLLFEVASGWFLMRRLHVWKHRVTLASVLPWFHTTFSAP